MRHPPSGCVPCLQPSAFSLDLSSPPLLSLNQMPLCPPPSRSPLQTGLSSWQRLGLQFFPGTFKKCRPSGLYAPKNQFIENIFELFWDPCRISVGTSFSSCLESVEWTPSASSLALRWAFQALCETTGKLLRGQVDTLSSYVGDCHVPFETFSVTFLGCKNISSIFRSSICHC